MQQDFQYNICMADFSMTETGETDKELRCAAGLSQDALAAMAGVAQNTISQYENGISEMSLGVLTRIATALETTADYLLGLSEY